MATIGAVEKLPRRMNEQFRSAVATLDRLPRRQRRYRFRRSKRTCLRVTTKRGNRADRLVDDVGKLTAWMQRKVSRARASLHGAERRDVRRQRSFPGVESINQNLIEPQIGHVSKAVPSVEIDAVRVRRFLTGLVHAGTRVLDERTRRFQRTTLGDWQHLHAPAAVVRHQNMATRLVHHQMARPRPS